MFTTCLDFASDTWEISVRLPPGCSHGVSVHDCMCVQISSLRWPLFPTCMQLILVAWYVTRTLCCHKLLDQCWVWEMLCWCKIIPQKYGSFVWPCISPAVRHNFCRSIFLHEIGGISWLTMCLLKCCLHSCRMFLLIVEYGLVHRSDYQLWDTLISVLIRLLCGRVLRAQTFSLCLSL